ncbi:MAG: sigma-70 family RNA polymerase sigma factor [Myxococcales bacterium]|nr:sigma-70 family RNA polymerase sigma factor [Myxococcales bacterium]
MAAFAPGRLVTHDEDLQPAYVARAQAGDARAFQELYRLHRRDVGRLVARLMGPRPEVDDVVQEVFLQVFRSLVSFRGESRFSTWLHRVTVNVTLMNIRAARSRPGLGNELTPAHEPTAAEEDSPFDVSARNQRMRALYAILDTLSEKKRAVFILHDIEGVAAAQIAEMVDSPVLTVRTRLFYARREVYAAMAQDKTLGAIAEELKLAAQEGASR